MNKEVWSNRVQYTVCSHLHLLQHLWLIYNKCIRITSYTLSKGPGLEVIKLENKLRLKQSAMIGCLRTRVRKQPIIALYFESENVLKLYNLESRSR